MGGGTPGRGLAEHLKEADEVAQHQAVDAGQRVHHSHGGLGALVVRDALLVELVRDQGLLQLSVPQLQQRRWGTGRGEGSAWPGAPPDGPAPKDSKVAGVYVGHGLRGLRPGPPLNPGGVDFARSWGAGLSFL